MNHEILQQNRLSYSCVVVVKQCSYEGFCCGSSQNFPVGKELRVSLSNQPKHLNPPARLPADKPSSTVHVECQQGVGVWKNEEDKANMIRCSHRPETQSLPPLALQTFSLALTYCLDYGMLLQNC